MTFSNDDLTSMKTFLEEKITQKTEIPLIVEKPIGYDVENGIRSWERVVDLAEVFTPSWLVEEMLNSIPDKVIVPEARTLEPSCGNGNFLVEIVARKLQSIKISNESNEMCFQVFKCITSTYGVDISESNVMEARSRLSDLVFGFLSKYKINFTNTNFEHAINYVLRNNILHADFLKNAESLEIIEFTFPKLCYVSQRIFTLLELMEINSESFVFPRPTRILPTVYYSDLK
jgi:hypothetical protein